MYKRMIYTVSFSLASLSIFSILKTVHLYAKFLDHFGRAISIAQLIYVASYRIYLMTTDDDAWSN